MRGKCNGDVKCDKLDVFYNKNEKELDDYFAFDEIKRSKQRTWKKIQGSIAQRWLCWPKQTWNSNLLN